VHLFIDHFLLSFPTSCIAYPGNLAVVQVTPHHQAQGNQTKLLGAQRSCKKQQHGRNWSVVNVKLFLQVGCCPEPSVKWAER
jgi:hypothetical protein